VARKRQSIDPEWGKQLFRSVLDSMAGRSAGRTSSALDILVGGADAPPLPVAFSMPAVVQARPSAPPAADHATVATPSRAALVAIDGQSFLVEGDLALIGRRAGRRAEPPDVDLSNHDPLQSVSRKHAWLERDRGGGFRLRVESDPPPTNPVLLDGEMVAPGDTRPLAPGVMIQVGLVELRYLFPAPAGPEG
jgi:hypothetical protein